MKEAARNPSVTVVICALNEGANLPFGLPKIPEWVDEVIMVDGGSRDDTIKVAKELRPDIRVLYQTGRGKGDALRHGIEQSNGDIVVTLDADGATDPQEMDRFIEPLLRGWDFAKGSRFRGGFPHNKPWYRILGNWAITLVFDILFFRKYTDLCSGYNSFWRKSFERADIRWRDGFENEPLINCRVAKNGLAVIEVGHSDGGRLNGVIKEKAWRQGLKAMRCIVRERFSA